MDRKGKLTKSLLKGKLRHIIFSPKSLLEDTWVRTRWHHAKSDQKLMLAGAGSVFMQEARKQRKVVI